MNRRAWLLITMGALSCSAPEVTERYAAERDLYRVESHFDQAHHRGQVRTRHRWREFARDFEAVATRVPASSSPELLEIADRAWLEAVRCHLAALDSSRAEIILATLASGSAAERPATFGEVAFLLGQVAERNGQYLAALHHYEDVVERVEPDSGPTPRELADPEAIPDMASADDFVLGLPLSMARMAARNLNLSDPARYYAAASEYYRSQSGNPEDFVRVEARILLAATEADQGHFGEAIEELLALEHEIPAEVMSRHSPSEIRLRAFEYRVDEWTWGRTNRATVRADLEDLVARYPIGSTPPGALFAYARGAAELSETEEALRVFQRLRLDHPTSTLIPEAELITAQLLMNSGQGMEALRGLRTLTREFPTSAAGLRAPLEIASYYRQLGDLAGEAEALQRAETNYRRILERYPDGDHSYFTREKLIQTLSLQGRRTDAVEELLALCDEVAAPTQRPGLLVDAARRLELELDEPARAASILERVGEEFPNTRIGRWSVRHAHQLRAAHPQ